VLNYITNVHSWHLLTLFNIQVRMKNFRACAILGSYSDGNTFWEHSMDDYDDPPQKVKLSPEGSVYFSMSIHHG